MNQVISRTFAATSGSKGHILVRVGTSPDARIVQVSLEVNDEYLVLSNQIELPVKDAHSLVELIQALFKSHL
jgi:hypothetical protein